MPLGDIWQLSVDQEVGNNPITNVHHFKQETVDGVGDVGQSLIDAYQINVEAAQLDCQSEELSIEGYRAIRVFPVPTQARVNLISAPGQLNGEAFPSNTCALVTWYSGPNSPVQSGRSWLGGIREVDVKDGLMKDSLNILITAFAQAVIGQIADGGGVGFRKVIFKLATQTAVNVITGETRSALRKLRSRTRGATGSPEAQVAAGHAAIFRR